VQVRAHGGITTAEVVPAADGDVRIALTEPLRGVAPGQAVAFYRPDAAGDVVLGSATIASTA
jgi:tRNA-specific 2-thiouridylase